MVSVHDVAAYILSRHGAVSAMTLQKLVYYSQAWAVTWDGVPLFAEPIQAWAGGPVAPDLYREHRGQFLVNAWPKGDPSKLSSGEQSTIEAVLAFYGTRSGDWLSELTHREDPWLHARNALSPAAPSTTEITLAAMKAYYSRFGIHDKALPAALARGVELLLSYSPDEAALLFEDDPGATLDTVLK